MNEVFMLERAAEAFDLMMSGKLVIKSALKTAHGPYFVNLPTSQSLYKQSPHQGFVETIDYYTTSAAINKVLLCIRISVIASKENPVL
jgi:hypothetical protein